MKTLNRMDCLISHWIYCFWSKIFDVLFFQYEVDNVNRDVLDYGTVGVQEERTLHFRIVNNNPVEVCYCNCKPNLCIIFLEDWITWSFKGRWLQGFSTGEYSVNSFFIQFLTLKRVIIRLGCYFYSSVRSLKALVVTFKNKRSVFHIHILRNSMSKL